MDAQDKQDKGQVKTQCHNSQKNEVPAISLLGV